MNGHSKKAGRKDEGGDWVGERTVNGGRGS